MQREASSSPTWPRRIWKPSKRRHFKKTIYYEVKLLYTYEAPEENLTTDVVSFTQKVKVVKLEQYSGATQN
jgi:hypothetical protein